jgi:long-subunit acyl-CoA synthetase (AMP-forming)/ribosomal protein S18 acetylase RimI-like enzyme
MTGTDLSSGAAFDAALLTRVRDALGPLEAGPAGGGRGVAAAATALLRATRETLQRLSDTEPAAAHGYRSLLHRVLESASARNVRTAFASTPFATEWTDLLLEAVIASDYTTGRLFFSRARALGDRTLFLLPWTRREGRVSWREAEARALDVGRALLASRGGVPTGGPIAVLGANSPELALFDLACLASGVVDVPVPANSTPAQVEFILGHCRASALFLGDEEAAAVAAPALNSSRIPAWWLPEEAPPSDRIRPFREFLDLGAGVSPEEVRHTSATVRSSDLATIMYTSGTTGAPKGVRFTHANLVTKRFARAAAWPDVGEGDVFLCYLPLYHTFGRWLEMLGCVFWGSVYAFVDDASIEPLLHSFARVRPTTFISVPKKWMQIAEAVAPLDETEPTSAADRTRMARELVERTGGRLRRGLSAAGYLPPSVFRRFHAAGIELHSGFGMTEATGGITMTPAADYRDDSIGLALPGIELRVAEDGELLIRGPYVTPPAADEPPREDGWLATGDIVRVDAQGHYRIIDRKKEIFKNVQGETISPRRIETLFEDFDSVERVLAVGDRREYCAALIVPDAELRSTFAASRRGDTLESPELREIFAPMVEAVNRFLAPFERVLDFAVLAEDLDPEKELTAKGTPKRSVVGERFAEVIRTIYAREQVSVSVGDVECKLPQWFLRNTGIPSRELRADGAELVAAGRRLLVRREPEGIVVGDALYDAGGPELLLGEIFGRARLWLGNDAVRRFAGPGIEHWWRRGVRFPTRTRLVRRLEVAGAPDPPPARHGSASIGDLHAVARVLADPDAARRRAAVVRLGEAVAGEARDGDPTAREILLSCLSDLEVRVDALRAVARSLSPAQLDGLVAERLPADPGFLTAEDAAELGPMTLRSDQLDALLARARAWCEPDAGVPAHALDRLIGWLRRVAVEHPESHLAVRSLLVDLAELPLDDALRARLEDHLGTLVREFRARLPAPATADGVTWEQAVELDGVSQDDGARIRRAVAAEKLLPEAMALFGTSPARDLPPLAARSVRISLLGLGEGRSVNLLEWSPTGLDHGPPRFECVVKVDRGLGWSEVQEEMRLLVRARTGGSGRPIVKTQGGGYREHGVWTEEFVPGKSLDQLVDALAAEDDGAGARLSELWPFLVSSCAALIVDFWRRTGRRVTLSHASPDKLVLPDHDWLVGGRLVSIAERRECDRLTEVLSGVHQGIVLPIAARHARAELDTAWPQLLSATLEVLGEIEGCARLEEEEKALDPDGELAGAIRRFVSGVRRRGFLPLRIRVAARRYRRWQQINADATLEAQAATLDQIEDAYGLRDLDRERPGSRLQLFRHTVFRGSGEELTHGLDELIARTLASAPSLAELHREVTGLRDTAHPSETDEFFLARMLYPHVDPRGRAVLVREEDQPGEFDTGVTVEHVDSEGEVFRIRRPANPGEIAALGRVFRAAGIRRTPRAGEDDLLLVTDADERVLGGLISRRISDTYARLDWLALGRHRRARGIGSILIREFLERLRAQGVRVVSTGFFRPAFFANFGFGVDPRYAGLVRFLDAESPAPLPGVKPTRDDSERER